MGDVSEPQVEKVRHGGGGGGGVGSNVGQSERSGGSDTPLHLYENGFTGRLRRTRFAFFTEGRAKCKTHVVQAADEFQG